MQNAVALKRKRSSGIFESWLTPKDSDLARFIQSWRDERAGKRMAEVVLLSDGPSYQTKDIEEYLSGAKFSVVNIHSAVEAVKYLETRCAACAGILQSALAADE